MYNFNLTAFVNQRIMKLRGGTEIKPFQWIGPSLGRKTRDRRRNFKYFCSFEYGDLEGRVGDHVLISNVDAADPQSVDGCDVAKILELYDLGEDAEDPHRAVVQWYSRPMQLPKKFSSHQMLFPSFDNNCEVLEDKRNFDNDVCIETFLSKCQVVQAMPDEDPREVAGTYVQGSVPVFVVRFLFTSHRGREGIEILPMSIEEFYDTEHVVDLESGSKGDGDVCGMRERRLKPGLLSRRECKRKNCDGDDSVDGSSSPEVTATGEPSLRYVLVSRGKKCKSHSSAPQAEDEEAGCVGAESCRGATSAGLSGLKLHQESPGKPSQEHSSKNGNFPLSHLQRGKFPKVCSSGKGKQCMAGKSQGLAEESRGKKWCRELRVEDIEGLLEEGSGGSAVGDGEPCYTSSMVTASKLKLLRVTSLESKEQSAEPFTPPCESPLAKFDSGLSAIGNSPRSMLRAKRFFQNYMEDSVAAHSSLPPGGSDSGLCVGKNADLGRLSNKEELLRKCLDDRQRSFGGPKAWGKAAAFVTRQGASAGLDHKLKVSSGHGGVSAMSLSSLDEAHARLHASAIPRCLPCREAEFSSIYSFVEDKIMDGVGGCMYICGVPGTGKTATVRAVVERLQEAVGNGLLPAFEFAEINGMRVTEPRRVYSEVLRVLTGRVGVGPEEAREVLEQRFSRPAPRRLPTLLLVDELDLLCTRRQDVVYNLMDWPSRDYSHLVVITIANTMDLPERVLMSKVCSRMGLTRLTFHPYTFQQLQEIVMSRMEGLKAFDTDAVQLVARKVAAVSGDARRALDICRRATECAESELLSEKMMLNQSPAARRKCGNKTVTSVLVTMQHVDQAVSEMISTSKAKAIQSCSEMEKIFLQAVASEVERTGIEEASFERVHSVAGTLCTYSGFRRPTITESMGICWRLGSLRLLLTETSSRADMLQRLMLNVDVDSVHYALRSPVAVS